jgi:choline dehydrogenase-like flavoprotein
MHYVIGSGPSGVACARALLRKGLRVTLIDTGLELDQARMQKLRRLEALPPAEWRGEPGDFLREGMSASIGGIPLKMSYGSAFPYHPVEGAPRVVLHNASLSPSYARGGLSNVWGGAVLPFCQNDLAGWPFGLDRLESHYRAVFEFMPLAARRDDLEKQFPLYAAHPSPIELSRQAGAMLRDLEAHRESLGGKGIGFGSARITFAREHNGHGCVRCGLCMYGCPYQLIYSSAATLAELQQHPGFRYLPGFQVRRLREEGNQVKLSARPSSGGPEQGFTAERVYLACGVLSTAALVLRSLERYGSPLWALDSQYFLLPLLRFRATPGVRGEPLHTLAQIFLEIADPAISPYTVHLQAYTYNDLFEQALRASLGPLGAIASRDLLLSRLLLLQGYLHSAHSPRIRIELQRAAAEDDEMLVTGEAGASSGRLVRKIARKLTGSARELAALPLSPLLRLASPGRGFHAGGTFPMRAQPREMESDIYGRPAGLTRIHIVDASVFPSIPATTITLTAMANAHRIADELEHYA